MNFGAFLSTGFLNKLKAVFGKTLWQQKFLTFDTSTNGILLTDLTFNNLTIGKTYKLTSHMQAINGGTNAALIHFNGANVILRNKNKVDANGDEDRSNTGTHTIFTATSTTVTTQYFQTNGAILEGNNSRNETNLILEELPNHEETTKFN